MKNPNWPKCPKCKTQQVRIVEFWREHTIEWEPNDLQEEGILSPGEPYMVHGLCLRCEHEWKIRGVIQVQFEWWDEQEPTE